LVHLVLQPLTTSKDLRQLVLVVIAVLGLIDVDAIPLLVLLASEGARRLLASGRFLASLTSGTLISEIVRAILTSPTLERERNPVILENLIMYLVILLLLCELLGSLFVLFK
jgi:hypothetical protein